MKQSGRRLRTSEFWLLFESHRANFFSMKQDMKNRAAFLKENLHKFPEHLQTKAKIEYHGLNLIELQEKVRKEVEATLVFEPPTEFLINPWSIRRSKVEYAQELKQHPDRAVLERKRRITNNLLLHTLAKHTREFRDFHKWVYSVLFMFHPFVLQRFDE